MNRARNERLAQTIHILNKDIRHLRAELALFGGLLAVFGLTHGRFPTYPSWALLGVGAGYLIARLIQAETIPGDDQLWITRPYHRVSLAAAKILFLVLFVNLPLFVVQMGIFLSQGFGVLENVAGILWTQCLLLFLVSIPIAAIASLTRGISGFALCGLILIGTVRGLDAFTSGAMTAVPANTLWIRYILPGLIIAITAVVILRLQYGSRRTRLSRILAAAALAAAFLAIPYLPSPIDGALRAWAMPGGDAGTPELRIRVDPSQTPRNAYRFLEPGQVEIELPFSLVPRQDDVFLDIVRFEIRLEGADGNEIRSVRGSLDGPGRAPKPTLYARLDRAVLETNQRAHLKAVFDVVLIGNTEERVVDASEGGFNVSGIDCHVHPVAPSDEYEFLECRSPFRWPEVWIQTDFGGDDAHSLRGNLSYSPFPGGIDLNRVESEIVARKPGQGRDIRIVTRRPVGHVRQELETEIDLREFVIPSPDVASLRR